MKRLVSFLLAIACVASLSVGSFAHSGKTDSNGGHYNRSTGEYHYHHGFSAHQHINGICPYDYVDNTKPNSGSSTIISGKPNDYAAATKEPAKKAEMEEPLWARILLWVGKIAVVIFGISFAYSAISAVAFWVWDIASRFKRKTEKKETNTVERVATPQQEVPEKACFKGMSKEAILDVELSPEQQGIVDRHYEKLQKNLRDKK